MGDIMALTDTQYDEIMSTYYENQFKNRSLLQERKEEIYHAIPRIEEIDEIIAQSSINAARNKLKGIDVSVENVKSQNALLVEEKTDLLKRHGYDADYLKPIYTCEICQDTGRIGNEYCTCFKQASLSFLYQQSTIEETLKVENFEHFNLEYYSKESDGTHPYTPYDNMKSILNHAHSFVDNFKEQGGNLLFFGGTGLGKTYLSNCIAKEILDANHTVLYQSAVHLFEDVCSDVLMKKNNNPYSSKLYHYLFDCDLLIIDDLGTEINTSFISSQLYDILNTRMRENKSTLISTNLTLQEISQRYSDRIISRILSSYQVYNFYGNDIRLVKRRANI